MDRVRVKVNSLVCCHVHTSSLRVRNAYRSLIPESSYGVHTHVNLFGEEVDFRNGLYGEATNGCS